MKYSTLFILIFVAICNCKAQFQLQAATEIGHSNVSEGMYLRSYVKGSYAINQFEFQSAVQNELISYNSSFFSAVNLAADYHFKLHSFPLNARVLFLQNLLSNYVSERNIAAFIRTEKQKWNATLGLGFKSIGFTKYARKQASINSNKSINENFNLLYNLNYSCLKPTSVWKLKFAFSNFDEFTINQATNPMLFINSAYALNNKLEVTTDLCYKTAGAFNLHVNYFGFYIRPGIRWKIN